MADDKPIQRGRRIHVEGADPAWTGSRPQAPPGFRPAAGPPGGQGAPPPTGLGAPLAGASSGPDLRAAAERETWERNRANALASIGAIAGRVAALRRRLEDIGGREVSRAAEAVAQARARAEELRIRRIGDLAARQRAEADALAGSLRDAVAVLAGPAATADWGDIAAAADGSSLSRYLRVGSLEIEGHQVPALVPFIGHRGVHVTGSREQVDGLLVAALARVVAQAPLKKLRIVVFDPRARGVLGRFASLRQAVGEAFPTPTSDARVFGDRLAEVLNTVSRDAELIAASSDGDLVDVWRDAPVPEGTLQLVVLLDYPSGVDSTVQNHLLRLADTESPVRPALFVAVDPTAAAASDVDPHALRSSLVDLVGEGGRWTVPGFPSELPIRDDGPPPDHVVAALVASATERTKSDTGPTVPLAELIGPDIATPWQHDSTDSLELPFGRAGRGILELSLRTENPPHPNMLVGGAVGTGKSNLLLDIIYGLAARYSPDEFELHLLDFKQGLEFARFAPDAQRVGWLPHVRTLGLESDRAFGIAVLDWFLDELERRSELFKSAGHSGIVGYRRATGETVPRLLLIIDEFHELFAGTDSERERAVEAVERLAKQGRVYGVHLLLASQTTSGVSALAVKGDGIFAQFPIRLSLKNTAAESEAILSQGNKAAADLTYRGEVVFNTNAGHAPQTSNQIGIAAYAEPEAMARLQESLWRRRPSEPPLVFFGKEYAAWPARRITAPQSGLEVWLGRPIAVSDAPRTHTVSEDADQAIVVLGQAKGNAPGPRDTLRTMILTALPGLAGGEVVVLDGDGAEADAWCSAIERHVRDAGTEFRRIDTHDAAAWIRTELKERIADGRAEAPLLVVGLSIQRLRELDLEDEGDGEFSLEDRTARTVLQDLARRGAQSRAFFFGSWNNVRTMEADLGSYGSGVAAYLTVDLGLEDLRTIAGPTAQRIEGSPRVGVFDRAAGDRLDVLIPYDRDGAPQEVSA